VAFHFQRFLNNTSLDLITAELVAPAIVGRRRARRGVVRHRPAPFERAAVLEIGGDAGCPEAVIADHRVGVLLEHRAGELAGAAAARLGSLP
jgi:hypothetical protein